MEPEAQAGHPAPEVDTPVRRANDSEAMLADLGKAVTPTEGGPENPVEPEAQAPTPTPAPTQEPEAPAEDPEKMMRDDYLKGKNQLNEREQSLNEREAELKRREEALQQAQQQPAEQPAEQARLPEIGEATILSQVGINIDPDDLNTDTERMLFGALQAVETVLQRHMIATDEMYKSQQHVQQHYQNEMSQKAQNMLDSAKEQLKQKYGVDVDTQKLADATTRFGRQLMESSQAQVLTPEIIVRSWEIENPDSKAQAPAPVAEPQAKPKVAPVPTMKPKTAPPEGGQVRSQESAQERVGRKHDVEKMLADLKASING